MEAEQSVWRARLDELRQQILEGDSITGAVTVSAISATLATSVLRMVLEVAARKRNSEELQGLMAAAREAAEELERLADEDRAAYTAYNQALKLPQSTPAERAARQRARAAALRHATEIPLQAARSASNAIEVCAQAAGIVTGDIAADVGGAAALLAGSVRAIMVSVDANLRHLQDQPAYGEMAVARRELERRASRQADSVLQRIASAR